MYAGPVDNQRRPGQFFLLETPIIAEPGGRTRLALDPAQTPEQLAGGFLAETIARLARLASQGVQRIPVQQPGPELRKRRGLVEQIKDNELAADRDHDAAGRVRTWQCVQMLLDVTASLLCGRPKRPRRRLARQRVQRAGHFVPDLPLIGTSLPALPLATTGPPSGSGPLSP